MAKSVWASRGHHIDFAKGQVEVASAIAMSPPALLVPCEFNKIEDACSQFGALRQPSSITIVYLYTYCTFYIRAIRCTCKHVNIISTYTYTCNLEFCNPSESLELDVGARRGSGARPRSDAPNK